MDYGCMDDVQYEKLLGSTGLIILLAVGIVAVYLISTKKEIVDSELGVMY